ncbi:MAG TPA: PKD domain-containing protein, partial [Candidatus Saccharimonadales bacterium]|nr:PKD domain-containing protein [Candidatus Saccharimonadales bacterium]
ALVAEAKQLVENVDKPSEILPAKLASRVKALRKAFAGVPDQDPTVKKLRSRFPVLFNEIATPDYEVPGNITPDLYVRLDAGTRRLELLSDYAMIGRNELDAERKQLFEEWGEWMLSTLQSEGFAALEQAQRILRVLQEWTFPGEFLNAIQAGKATIELDVMRPKENDPVQFQVRFTEERLNGASARQVAGCQWDFGDGLSEIGWKVTHYFPVAAEYQVKATVTHPSKPSADVPARTVKVEKATADRKLLSARTRVELIRVSIALAAAVLALVGGAREQLLQLDCIPGLVAVFLAGFGADTIKNLLTQRP